MIVWAIPFAVVSTESFWLTAIDNAHQTDIPMLAVGLCFELQPDTVQLVADFVLSTITVKGQLSGMLKTVMCHFQENYMTVLESYDPADHGMEPYTRREEL